MKTIIPFSAMLFALAFSFRAALAADAGSEGDGDFRVGPSYTNAPETIVRENVPKGTVHHFVMKSEDSKIYPGIRGAYTRDVYVYVPKQYVAGTAAPFIVAQDGKSYTNRLPVIFDNMIHETRLPVMIAVMVQHGGGDGKGSERGLEYDTVSDRYTTFIETEVLPKITKDYNVTFTTDPEGRATLGCSSGAAAAFTMAWFRPDLYRRVVSYSGTFVDQQSPANPSSPQGAWGYHEYFIKASPRKPLRVWMHVSENDNRANDPESTLHNWVMANQRMAAAFKAKGYHHRFVFSEASRHCDGRVVAHTLPEALEWLWRGYPIK